MRRAQQERKEQEDDRYKALNLQSQGADVAFCEARNATEKNFLFSIIGYRKSSIPAVSVSSEMADGEWRIGLIRCWNNAPRLKIGCYNQLSNSGLGSSRESRGSQNRNIR